jgi:hypothetical protein
MPPVIAAAAVAVVGVALEVTTIMAALISVATTAVTYGASQLLAPKPRKGATSPAAAPANDQRAVPIAQPVPPRRLAYGACRIGGAYFFVENANPWLYIGTALSDGRCETVEALYIGEEAVPIDGTGAAAAGSRYYGRLSREFADGRTDQAASATLTGAFPSLLDSTFRQRGVTRGAVALHWGADAQDHQVLWGDGVHPSYQGRWRWVYDPRDGTQSVTDATTWKYSDNPALCIADAMRHAWGVAVPQTAIDWDAVAAAATVCDATLTYQGQTVKIFTLAGVFEADAGGLGAQLQDMLSSCRGKLTFRDGKYALVADQARASVWTITDDDVLELGEAQLAGETGTRWDAIAADHFDATDAGRRTTTTAYELTAGGRETTLTLPFTPRSHSAQILAYRELQASRDGRAAAIRVTDAGLYLSPGDVVTLSLAAAAWLNGSWEVVQVDLAQVGVMLTLRGYNPAVYTDPSTYLV